MPFCCLSLKAPKPKPDGYPERPETLGEHIRKRRMDLGLLQKEAAARLGIDDATLWNWEHDKGSPAVRHWPALLAFLGYDPHPESQTLAEKLIATRRRRGLSQRKLARQLGLDESTVSRLEAGDRPRRKTLAALQALGLLQPRAVAVHLGLLMVASASGLLKL